MPDARYTHPNQQLGSKVALAHTVYGSPAAGYKTVIADSPGATRVTGTMMRPYEPPKRRGKDNPKIELCIEDGCKAFAAKSLKGYCPGHARNHGLIRLCAKDGCRALAKKEQDWCHHHVPKPDPQPEVEGVTEAELFGDDPD